MPYVARKHMTLAGEQVERGRIVPDKLLATIPENRFAALVRTNLLQAVTEPEPVVEPEPVACPLCDDGKTYDRLAQHISRTHNRTMASLADEPEPIEVAE